MAFIAWRDIKSRTIPDAWLWPLLLGGIYLYGGVSENVVAAICGYALGFALMAATMKKEALGFGDVELLAVTGLWLGIGGLAAALVSAAALGIAWGLAKKQRFVPLAPFLFLGWGIFYAAEGLGII